MSRRIRGPTLVLLALVTGCADTARRNYLDEALDDIPGAPADAAALGEELTREAAGDPAEGDLSLAECMRLALLHSERLAARGEDILQADTLRVEAITRLLPRAAFNLSHTRDSTPVSFGGSVFLPQERTEHSVSLSQPLFDPGVLPAYRLAVATRRLEALLLDDARDELMFQVAAEFYGVFGFEQDVVALRAALEQLVEQLRVLEVRLAVGEAQRQEVLLAEARRAEVEVDLVQSQFEADRARARLGRLLGTRPPRRLVDSLEVAPPPGDVAALTLRALDARPDVEAARAQVEQAGERRDLVLADYLPTVTLDVTYYTRAVGGFAQFIDWTASANLTWSVFDGGAREARLVRAASEQREQRLLATALEEDVRLEVLEAVLAFAALDRARAALEARRVAATGAQELAAIQFEAGEATNLDVLVATAERQQAERNQSRSDASWKLAALRLWLATGEIVRSPPGRRLLERSR